MENGYFFRQILNRLDDISTENLKIIIENYVHDLSIIKSVVDTIPSGLCVCDKQGFFLYLNVSASRFLSVKQHHLHHIRNGGQVNFFSTVRNGDIRAFLAKAQRQSYGKLVSDDTKITLHSGKKRIVVMESFPFMIQGQHMGVVVKIDDVTEKRGKERMYQQMQSLINLTNFSANLAHEIKNPLGSISVYMQLLQKTAKKIRTSNTVPDEEHFEKYISVVNEEIDRLNSLVINFLDAVKPMNAQLSLQDPNEILAKLVEFSEVEFSEKSITLKKEFCEEHCEIFLNEDLFKQMILNLAQNSIFAMKDTEDPVFTIKSCVENNNFILTLEDNGCGMDKNTCARIFEPYFTTKTSGTGLGMTTVYKIVKEFNGRISVKSKLGKGTKFILIFPIPQKKVRLLT